ncbi:hypothetical protein [Amycolatopsis sp. lyj-23]|uniref:hypothetical protein n=1 Tax=Amycolatopsis sp. lyj-23 TaxID=2789283 RepID=UPI00397C78DE
MFGDPVRPLVRLHPECLTGDVFGSAPCGTSRRRAGTPTTRSPCPNWPGDARSAVRIGA